MAINPMAYSSKDVVLDVVRTERGNFYDVIDRPENWLVDTRCEGWQVRDIVGHMIDVTESYLARWDIARKGEDAAGAAGWAAMADALNKGALAFRSLPRDEAIARLKSDSDELMSTFDDLNEEQWSGFNVAHVFTGAIPAFCYPAFQIMDYGVHSWDMRWGLGDKDARLDERTAGVLIPYMFIVWQGTVDPEAAKGVDITYGSQGRRRVGRPVEDHGQRRAVQLRSRRRPERRPGCVPFRASLGYGADDLPAHSGRGRDGRSRGCRKGSRPVLPYLGGVRRLAGGERRAWRACGRASTCVDALQARLQSPATTKAGCQHD